MVKKTGGAERDRTVDLMTASHALSHLSYSPTGIFITTCNLIVNEYIGLCGLSSLFGLSGFFNETDKTDQRDEKDFIIVYDLQFTVSFRRRFLIFPEAVFGSFSVNSIYFGILYFASLSFRNS